MNRHNWRYLAKAVLVATVVLFPLAGKAAVPWSEDARIDTVKLLLAAISSGRADRIEELVAQEARIALPTGNTTPARAYLRDRTRELASGLTAASMSASAIYSNGSYVLVDGEITGSHTGIIAGLSGRGGAAKSRFLLQVFFLGDQIGDIVTNAFYEELVFRLATPIRPSLPPVVGPVPAIGGRAPSGPAPLAPSVGSTPLFPASPARSFKARGAPPLVRKDFEEIQRWAAPAPALRTPATGRVVEYDSGQLNRATGGTVRVTDVGNFGAMLFVRATFLPRTGASVRFSVLLQRAGGTVITKATLFH